MIPTIQRFRSASLLQTLLLVHPFLLKLKHCLLVVFVSNNNIVDNAPNRVRCVEEAFYGSAMINHVVPVLLFQVLLPFNFNRFTKRGGELIPHRGGENDLLCSAGTGEFFEHEEIAVGCCGHPQISDSLHIHDPR